MLLWGSNVAGPPQAAALAPEFERRTCKTGRGSVTGGLGHGDRTRQETQDARRQRARSRPLTARLGRDPAHDLLHVRLPLRHQRPPAHGRERRSAGPLHRGQPRPPGEPRRDLRQGLGRDHAALLARPADEAAAARRAARLGAVPRDLLGGGAADRRRLAGAGAREGPGEARLLHRARPVAVADLVVGAAVRHAELCRPWRVLLGQHGGRRHLHDRRRLLGVRIARLGPDEALHDLRRRRGPRLRTRSRSAWAG